MQKSARASLKVVCISADDLFDETKTLEFFQMTFSLHLIFLLVKRGFTLVLLAPCVVIIHHLSYRFSNAI